MKDAEAAGKYYLGITPSTATDRAAARYGFATMLLAGGGKLQFALHNDYTNERWFEEYDYAIGNPAGRRDQGRERRPPARLLQRPRLRQPDGERRARRLRRRLHRLRPAERDLDDLAATKRLGARQGR